VLKEKNQGDPEEQAVRERLLTAALELFTTKGYAATPVREIVEAAGVTTPVLYYYFGNKEGIYQTLMEEPFLRFDALLDAFRGGTGNIRERLPELCDRILVLFVEHLDTARLMYSIYYGPPQGAPYFDFDVYHAKLHDLMKELIAAGIHAGELRAEDVEEMGWVIIGALNVVLEEQLCQTAPRIGREGLDRVINLILRSFSAADGTMEVRQ
jgi:AcrR family transcriptional regulator